MGKLYQVVKLGRVLFFEIRIYRKRLIKKEVAGFVSWILGFRLFGWALLKEEHNHGN